MLISDLLTRKQELPKADRGPKLLLSPQNDSGDYLANRKSLLLDYEKDSNTFLNTSDSQLCSSMLKRISNSPLISYISRAQPLLRLLIDTAQVVMLTPIEITVFDIYLSRFGWNDTSLPLDCLLLYVGFAAKRYMGGRIHPIAEYLNYSTRNFSDGFYRWDNGTLKELDIDMYQLNEAYNKLTEKSLEKSINYNYYVDEILQISPPYQTDSKESIEKLNIEKRKGPKESAKEENAPRMNLPEMVSSMPKRETEVRTVPVSHRVLYDKIDTICTEFLIANQIQQTLIATGNMPTLNIKNIIENRGNC